VGALLAGVVILIVVVYASYRLWSTVSLVLACFGFLLLGPAVFGIHLGLMTLTPDQAKDVESYLYPACIAPPAFSLILIAIAAAKAHRFSWPSIGSFLGRHILLTQPTIAVFVGSAIATLAALNLEVSMTNDDVMLMSLFATIVFLVCAWFLPYALRPMLRLNGRSDTTSDMLANLIGLLLALMVAIVAFKAREKFGDIHSALNTLVDSVIAFLVAAMSGAGALLAAGKAKARGKPDNQSSGQ
jgi:hypothetical protein